MRKSTLLIIGMVMSIISLAQSNGKITGTVIDGSQKTIESATISLLNAMDSTVSKFSVAGKTGQFVFEGIPYGKYLVSISAVGHQKGFSEIFDLNADNSSIQLKTIELIPVSKAMQGIVITGKKPLVEQKIDRTIVNVDAAVTNVGTSAMEVLEKAPGVSVDKDGNISLKGKEGVVILVDGRPTQLGGADLANLLRSMNSSQLDQIEIMTNPPAKFDAAGNAGVINIKTKKTRQFGYSGSVTVGYGQGRYPKYNESFNFNYRKNKINFFTSLNHNGRKDFQTLDIQRTFRDKNSKELISYFDQQARMNSNRNYYSGKIGLDYFAGKNTSFGVVLNGFKSPSTSTNRNVTNIYDLNNQLSGQTRAISTGDRLFENYSGNLNFRQILDTTGKEITADFDYIQYSGKRDLTMSNSYYNASGIEYQKADTLYSHLPQEIEILSGKIDYSHPLKNGARFEAGLKSSIVTTDNNAIYDTVHNGVVIHDLGRSNYFIYEENINAAYVNISGPLSKKFNGQVGLRMENTVAKGKQLTTSENFDRNYTDIFPTAYLQYKANEKNSFVLNYGRRIRRPNYESLNPFIDYLDRYTYQQGNPNLKPQFSHNIELSHNFKGFLNSTINYTNTNDIIQQVIEQNEANNETYVKRANIASQRQFGVSVSLGMPLTKWWTTNVYVNAFNSEFEGIVNQEFVTINSSTIMVNGSQQFKITKNTSAEISGWYRTAGIEGFMTVRPVGAMSVGFSQNVMKGKGSIRLNVQDVFKTQVFKARVKYGSVDGAFQEARDSRVVNIAFTYKFSKGKMGNTKKRNNGSASEEQNRIGN